MSRHMAHVHARVRPWGPEGRRDLGDFNHGGGTREDAEVWVAHLRGPP